MGTALAAALFLLVAFRHLRFILGGIVFRKLSKMAAVVTFATAALVGVGVGVAPANAAVIGEVEVGPHGPGWGLPTRAELWEGSWGLAWDACRGRYPRTRSVELMGLAGGGLGPAGWSYFTRWNCRDTP